MKPVRLTVSATLRLPRWVLLLLALIYILAGLIGREPWKNEDAIGFGIMWTMANGSLSDWFVPNIIGTTIAQDGPLAFWIGAICIKIFSLFTNEAMAARFANIFYFLLGSISVWFATYRLGQRDEAQPMRLAFGGQPEPKDYGRTLADGAALIFMGSLGLFMHSHETKTEALLVAIIAFLFYACIRYAEQQSFRNLCFIGLSLSGICLTRGFVLSSWILIILTLFFIWQHKTPLQTIRHFASATLIMLMPTILWLVIAHNVISSNYVSEWISANWAQVGFPQFNILTYLLKNSLWFFWPAWPFAVWSVYSWRRQSRDLHIILPILITISLLIFTCFTHIRDESFLLLSIPSMAILASFGLPTMRRGAINATDWFSVMGLTACAIFIWIGWIALQTGWPPRMVKNIAKYAPGFVFEFNIIAFVVALCASIAWIVLIYWRISRQPKVIWRAVVLSSGGLIFLWLLLTTLWLPWINYSKSYKGIAENLSKKINKDACVYAHVAPAQRASFAYLGQIKIAKNYTQECKYILIQDRTEKRKSNAPPPKLPLPRKTWKLVWEGARPGETYEYFRLFKLP